MDADALAYVTSLFQLLFSGEPRMTKEIERRRSSMKRGSCPSFACDEKCLLTGPPNAYTIAYSQGHMRPTSILVGPILSAGY